VTRTFVDRSGVRAIVAVAAVVIGTLAVAVLPLGVVACGGNGQATTTEVEHNIEATTLDPALIGTWRSDAAGETLEFGADGMLTITDDAGDVQKTPYSADGSEIILSQGLVEKEADYSIAGDVLSLVDPDTSEAVDYTRVPK
jgi:hypothetical protein